jgi:hypothetical protein
MAMTFDAMRGLASMRGPQALRDYDAREENAIDLERKKIALKREKREGRKEEEKEALSSVAKTLSRDPSGQINLNKAADYLDAHGQPEMAAQLRINEKARIAGIQQEKDMADHLQATKDSIILDANGQPTDKVDPQKYARRRVELNPETGLQILSNYTSAMQGVMNMQITNLAFRRELTSQGEAFAKGGDIENAKHAFQEAGIVDPQGNPIQSVDAAKDGSWIVNGQKVPATYFTNHIATAAQNANDTLLRLREDLDYKRKLELLAIKEQQDALVESTPKPGDVKYTDSVLAADPKTKGMDETERWILATKITQRTQDIQRSNKAYISRDAAWFQAYAEVTKEPEFEPSGMPTGWDWFGGLIGFTQARYRPDVGKRLANSPASTKKIGDVVEINGRKVKITGFNADGTAKGLPVDEIGQ